MRAINLTLAGILSLAACSTMAQTVVIDSLDGNGKLTATVPSGSVYSVEWKGALDSTNGWQKDWSQLRRHSGADGSVEVEVPMAFRLTCWTNGLFLNAPIGRTFHYSVTNQVGEVWRQEIRVLGDICMPVTGESYRMISTEEFYGHADFPPSGAQARSVSLIRSEEDRSFLFDFFKRTDVNEWRDAADGTQWSYFSSSVETTNDTEIVGHEDVDVVTTNGTVTYADCVRIDTEGRSNGFDWQLAYPDRRYTDWIKPGGYLVKRENYWVHVLETNAAPVVYELQGWTDE